MHGDIKVESELNKGSKFSFDIELKIYDMGFNKKESSNIDKELILLCATNLLNLKVFEEVFGYYNINFEYVNKFSDNILFEKYGLLIIDLLEPTYSEVEALKQLSKKIQIIVMTNNNNFIEENDLQDFGNILILQKPLKRSKLTDLLNIHNKEDKIKEEIINEPALDLSNIRMLLVEDNAVNQIVAVSMLEKFNAKIEVAENGLIAIEKVNNTKYDIIFMDCQMPEMDGFEATGIIRKNESVRNLVVAMTANAMSGDKEKCIEAGMDDYISKPLKESELIEMLKKYFSK